MKRMLLTISYDGTAYHGWQVQPNGVTVQQTLQDCLERLLGSRPDVTGCSRTDAGVHARKFCCHFDCDDKFPETAFLRGLDALLPEDICVRDCREAPCGFHSRYDAKGKTYCYYFLNSSLRDPFLSRYSWRIERRLRLEPINEFCRLITGRHDFRAFSSSGRTAEGTVRTVKECYALRDGDMLVLKITADGFLYNMVRIIAGTAAAVSDGRISSDKVEEAFLSGDRSLLGETAPARGLFLEEIIY